MTNAYQKALEKLWTDRCSIIAGEKVIDRESKLTQFTEKVLVEDAPCRLSFEQLSFANGDPVAVISQSVKLFLAADIVVPPGCKIIVKRNINGEREFVYHHSGEPGIYTYHQEIMLLPWKGWA